MGTHEVEDGQPLTDDGWGKGQPMKQRDVTSTMVGKRRRLVRRMVTGEATRGREAAR